MTDFTAMIIQGSRAVSSEAIDRREKGQEQQSTSSNIGGTLSGDSSCYLDWLSWRKQGEAMGAVSTLITPSECAIK